MTAVRRAITSGLPSLSVLTLCAVTAAASQRPLTERQSAQAPGAPRGQVVSPAPPADAAAPMADMWLVIYNVLPDRTADFEAVASRVRDALVASQDPRRRRQADGLRIHRSALPNPDGGTSVYFVQVPTEANNDAERTGLDVLIDAVLPAEATALKARLVAALDPRNPSGNTLMLAVR